MKYLLVLALVIGHVLFGISQHLTPNIKNFQTFETGAGHQNWSIDQAPNGFIYVANNSGLLEFNGISWKLYLLPQNKIVRSVRCHDDRIYIGAYNEFGYFEKDEDNQLVYHTLNDGLTNYQFRDEEFWQIEPLGDQVAFRSYRDVYLLDKQDHITPLQLNVVPTEIIGVDNTLYCATVNNAILAIKNKQVKNISDQFEMQFKGLIHFASDKNNQLLICDSDFNCFVKTANHPAENKPVPFKANSFFNDNQLNHINVLKDGSYVLGSIQKGIAVFNPDGALHYRLQQNSGLTNNTVLNQLIDQDQNIWLALDDGVSFINNASPNRYFIDRTGELGSVYTMATYHDQLYLGTNKGVFYFENDVLKQVPDINGQVWILKVIDDDLICGQNFGTYRIRSTKVDKIGDQSGVWTIKAVPHNDGQYMQSTYNGFVKMIKTDHWQFERIKGLFSPVRNFEFHDENTVIAIHPYEGVFRFSIAQDSISSKKHLLAPNNDNFDFDVTKINDVLLVWTNKQWLRYDAILDSLVQDQSLDQALQLHRHPSIIKSNNSEELWYRVGDYITRFNWATNQFNHSSFNNLNARVIPDYQQVLPYQQTFYLNFIDGFASSQFISENTPTKQIKIQRLSNQRDTIQSFSERIAINYNQNSLHLTFSFPEYAQNVQFEYRLDQEHWHAVTAKQKVLLENVPMGRHTVQVRAVYPNGQFSNVDAISFRIKWPLFFQWPAILLYVLGALFTFVAIRTYQKRKYIKRRKRSEEMLAEKHQRQMEREKILSQKRLAELENKNLNHQIEFRQKELANTTLNLVQKNELLTEIKDKLNQAKKTGKQIQVNEVIRLINQSLSQSENWKLFETQFNEIHQEFLTRLKNQYPDLTKKDLKLCAYIKTGLSSKEIAPLMNISVRGVETHRYRLRKKLSIDSNENLIHYLESL